MTLLKFRRDARILLVEHGQPDRLLDPESPFELLRYLRSAIAFEEGLTTAGLFRCLRPWGDLVGNMAWLDFASWDKIVAVSHVRDAATVDRGDDPPLAEIVLYPSIEIRQGNLVSTWHNQALTVPDGTGEVRTYAFDLSPPEEWIGLPIRIEETCAPTVVTRHSRKNWQTTHLPPTRVYPSFFDTVILGFLDDISFHGSPEQVADTRADLLGKLEEVRAMVEAGEPDGGKI